MSLLCFANIILPDMRHLVRKNPYATSAELVNNNNNNNIAFFPKQVGVG